MMIQILAPPIICSMENIGMLNSEMTTVLVQIYINSSTTIILLIYLFFICTHLVRMRKLMDTYNRLKIFTAYP